ncbi:MULTISPECIES: hypothetical protein [Citrobacter]|nr:MULTISPECIES: hypothetical protein [Citrobacter]
MKVLDSNVTYGNARGYEQYYIEKYGLKLAFGIKPYQKQIEETK